VVQGVVQEEVQGVVWATSRGWQGKHQRAVTTTTTTTTTTTGDGSQNFVDTGKSTWPPGRERGGTNRSSWGRGNGSCGRGAARLKQWA